MGKGNLASPPAEATNLVAIATGNYHRVGLRDDGKVFSWGFENGNAGQTRVPPTSRRSSQLQPPETPLWRDPCHARTRTSRANHDGQTLFTGQSLRLEAQGLSWRRRPSRISGSKMEWSFPLRRTPFLRFPLRRSLMRATIPFARATPLELTPAVKPK